MFRKTRSRAVNKFIEKEIRHCEDNGIAVEFQETDYCDIEIGKTLGWFDGKTLAVATKKNFQIWLGVFVHESCHKDQMLEKSPIWNTEFRGGEAFEALDRWLKKEIELSSRDLNTIIHIARNLELDCEKRAVRKIYEFNLPLDIDLYIKCANAYVWSYSALKYTREWKFGISENAQVQKLMPSLFQTDYNKMPDGYLELVRQL